VKRGTPEHFKTMRLATLLSAERPCDRAEALGIVEALCNHFAPRSAPQGNVGRCTNREIADGCYSTRDADTLVHALVESRWLDEHPEQRLLIHDWKEHADESVRKWLIRNKLPWLTPSGRCRVTVRTASRQRRDAVRPPRAGNGNGNGSSLLPESEGGMGGNQGSGERADRGIGKGGRKVRRLMTGWPADLALTDDLRAFAADGGLDPALTWGHFRDHHQARGSTFVDWTAAFRTWCRNAVKFAASRRA
jgi:hypothetical protein